MSILFYLGHPAHFHLFKHAIQHLGTNAIVVIKSKDVLESLLRENNISFHRVEEKIKSNGGKFSLGIRMLKRSLKIYLLIRKYKPGLLVGSPAELAFTGFISGTPAHLFFEDDLEKVAPYGSFTGPFAEKLVCPDVCSAGKWKAKKVGYPSYHELAYLHPDHFHPDKEKIKHLFNGNEKYFIIRFVELGAFHDAGKTGITNEIATSIVEKLIPHGKVYITSERQLPENLEPFKIQIPTSDMHHAISFATMFIGDSQTMTAEAAVLGTPAIRFNDFVGELSYLEDLEHNYQLTFGFKTNNHEGMLNKMNELLQETTLKQIWSERKKIMLKNKINLANWMIKYLAEQNISK